MSSKVAELKQSLCFRSLRLMGWRDSQNSSLRSFSDSETVYSSSRPTTEEVTKSKSKSETNLTSLKRNKKEDQSYDNSKHSFDFDPFVPKSKKAEITNELKNINTDFKKATSLEIEALDISNNVRQSDVESPGNHSRSISSEKAIPNSTTENNECIEIISSTNHNTTTMEKPNSSPYPVLEASKTELILGEPRCLTLKKNDIDPFLTDDILMFEPDFEDDNRSFNKKPTPPKAVERKIDKFVGDMFIDEEEISSTKKRGLLIDREEGELTPEAPHKSSDLNKAKEPSSSEKKTTLEFFNKINECLRELNDKCREFYSSSTPDYSLTHLQRTMGNVDNIKRKLAFLIKSKNTEIGEKDREKKNELRSHANMRLHSERLAKSNSVVNDNKREQDKQEQCSSFKNDIEELYRQLKENREKRNSEIISRHGHRREKYIRDKPSQADLLNRKKISILEKLGTKQEIERVQSLFKRQMNLITQHVIQKKEIDKRHTSKPERNQRRRRRRYSSQSQDEEKPRDKVSLNDLKTLEDMEAFLDSLKKDKILCEQYMDDQKSKGMLKFSSRKEKRIIQDTPSVATVKTSKDPKEALKQSLSKTACDTDIPKPNKLFQEGEVKQKAGEIKTKVAKNINTVSALDAINRHKSDDYSKKPGPSYPDHGSRSIMDLSKSTHQKEPEISINETEKHRQTQHDLDTHLEPNKGEIQMRKKIEPHHKSHGPQNISEERKEDFKRKREDLSDANFKKSENETEEKISKKQKVPKYLAARRLSEENRSQKDCNTRDAKTNIGNAESLVKDLLSRKVVILNDNGVAVNKEFCIKVINNEVFLKKVGNKRKRKHSGRALKPQKTKNMKLNKNDQPAPKEEVVEAKPEPDQKRTEPKLDPEPEIDPETIDTTLNEMENFLQDLRSKRKVRDDQTHHPIEHTSQNKEMKFLARIQAKRKAKLMACVSEGVYSTEKEAKFLKALEKRDEDVSESSDVETRKQALFGKIRAERDAIAEKPKAKQNDDDPLKDVKAFLDMIKEAESVNDENAKQVYVSFSLKRSDVKKLENLTTASLLTEESQKFLNSVRSKMKAKKAPTSGIGALMKKPEL